MVNRTRWWCVVGFFLVWHFSSQASPLESIYTAMVGQANFTSPTSFQTQAAGHYTGGGFVMRQKTKTVQPIHVSLPKVGMDGCGKMDLFFGSLSFVSSEELVDLGRQIISQAPTYSFQLALKTMAPQIENLFTQLRDQVNKMNALMLNSCQAAQSLVHSAWPANTAASETICKQEMARGDRDTYAARKHCQQEGNVASSVERVRRANPDLLAGEYNLVWLVLKKMPAYSHNQEMAEFIMTLVGTVIAKKEGDKFVIQDVPPKGESLPFIAAFIKGGTTSMLHCDDGQHCYHPEVKPYEVTEERSLRTKVLKRLQGLQEKYVQKNHLTDEDMYFLSDAVMVPVYKYIQVMTALGGGLTITQQAAEHIAVSVLLHQFQRIMEDIEDAVEVLASVQVHDEPLRRFKDRLSKAKYLIQQFITVANTEAIWKLNKAVQSMETMVVTRHSTQ